MRYNELVKFVATDFREEVEENGFASFDEMTRCYQMDSSDIKAEVEAIINATKTAYMDDSGIVIFNEENTEPYSYKTFIRLVRKELQ